ncbi:hypothetical protein [[Actinomadura] parvosata]|uniref:hypothetical protein n=1 Tax=[Actinomadura] parvosata TaxID=1955412 RepID=UPI001E3AFC63|nr:hypothetical protein [Nonomuraea sp. ATCC 55076]
MSGSADRLPRLLALVPYLMSHPGAQVGEVADVFGLSEKQLIDDLQLVWMCGLPGHTPGDLIDVSWDGGEIIIDNADTIARPLRLGIDEASALLVALRMLAATPSWRRCPATRCRASWPSWSGPRARAPPPSAPRSPWTSRPRPTRCPACARA